MVAQPHHHRARGDIRFMIQPGAHPQNIRVDDDGRLWGEVPVVPFREVNLDPVLLNTGVRSTRAAARALGSPNRTRPTMFLATSSGPTLWGPAPSRSSWR